ncbi:hypothetical protein OG455_08525 [Kitasatospora sp. NBC_01287]|uniref:hypothetical protein n=1 Tax=Kitasatospora sp. NBC_01287 TaxID=2903573 RepID=UPI00224F106F|nr:hypothetical protein [Kitasatospora sp. NBC_01287]MCX4745567.1 hypothetical protein [Kitasatospora sp. NBC_01287]
MTDDPSRAALDRVRAVVWNDWDGAFEHTRSRAALMREYLRRAALWARWCGAEEAWPFLDLAERVDPGTRAAEDVVDELEEYLAEQVGRHSIRETCRGAVQWAALRAGSHVELPDLPDPYEPLLLMYERGGGFHIEEFIDLNGVMVRLKRLEDHLSPEPVVALDRAALDALDTPAG